MMITPEKYDGHKESGYDIALIGLDTDNLLKLESYFISLKSFDIDKKPYFETNELNDFI